MFPLTALPLAVGQPRSVRLVDDVMRGNRLMALVAQRDAKEEPATPADLHAIGTVGVIHQLARTPDGSIRLMIQGLERIRLLDLVGTEPYLVARVEVAPSSRSRRQATEVDALRRAVVDIFRRLVEASPELPDELAAAVESVVDPRHLLYFVASVIPLDVGARQELLEMDPIPAKLRRAGRPAAARAGRARAGPEDHDRHRGAAHQEAARVLSARAAPIDPARARGRGCRATARWPSSAGASRRPACPRRRGARRSASSSRLAGLSPASPEHGMIVTYLEWMASLPWTKLGGGAIDIRRARAGPGRGPLRSGEGQGPASSSTWPSRSSARSGGAGGPDGRRRRGSRARRAAARHRRQPCARADPLLRGPARVWARRASARASPGRSVGGSCACRWAECGTRRRSGAIGGRTSARSPAASSRGSGGPRAATRSSCSTRSTRSARTGGATPPRRSSRCWIPPRTTPSSTTISGWPSTSRRCCSSPPPTRSTRFPGRCATGWRS